jgi:protein ImuA
LIPSFLEKNISGTDNMIESIHSIVALRRHIASLDRAPARQQRARTTTGHGPLDRALDGGMARACVHELFGAGEEEGAATGFSLLLAHQSAGDAPLLWLRTQAAARAGGLAYGPGLAALGIDPARLLVGMMADDAMLLRAAVDALRCPAVGALVIELRGRAPLYDLTASRRLALAAEGSGVTAFLLRIGAEPVPSAAETRWRVTAAPSTPVPGNGPGLTAFDLHLLRRRAGPDGLRWRLAWDNETGAFEDGRHERDDDRERCGDPALSGAVVSLSAAGPAAGRAA